LISRYVFREALGSTLIVIAVLFAILMSNQFAEILGDAASDALPRDAVFRVFWLTSMRYLTFIAPVGLFLGVMLALARLNRDSEMAALSACGVGPGKLMLPIGSLTLVLALVCGWLTFVEAPRANLEVEEIRFAAEADLELGVFEGGRFATPDSGDCVFHTERVDGAQIHNVFWQCNDDERVVVILADRGERMIDPATGESLFVLYDGRRYEGQPGDLDWSEVEFAEHGIPLREDEEEEFVTSPAMKPTATLLASNDIEDLAELQSRLSLPLSLFVLAVLAVPLSRSSPREGRYARLGIGILIYLSYANLQSLARVWLEHREVPPWVGIWWVHLALALFALTLFARESGWFVRRRRIARRVGPTIGAAA
jgi:lipopolysaccharide export system permease protein